jgi:hypothetical protein
LQATVSSSPYNFDWSNGTAGTHTLAVMAYSNAGISACHAMTVTNK